MSRRDRGPPGARPDIGRGTSVRGQLYVSAHHWPRAWYNRALKNPKVQVTVDGEKKNYLAVPITGEEHVRVVADNRIGIHYRILMGFAPRSLLRLDPR